MTAFYDVTFVMLNANVLQIGALEVELEDSRT